MRKFFKADTQVIRFNISVNKFPTVNELDSRDYLIDQHKNRLK